MVALTELLAASIAASLARAGGVVGPSAPSRLWPRGVPRALDLEALRDAIRELPLGRRPIDRPSAIDAILVLIPNRAAPTTLAALTLEVANLLIHIGRRLEATEDADARFGIAFAVWPCIVEGHFVLATLLAAAVDDDRLVATVDPMARAVEDLIALAARCGGTAEA